ncbi:MAG: ElaA protein [Saprospiraceae bacterium]|jgi:ElaA protein
MSENTISFYSKSFDQLSTIELYKVLQLRQKVFVVEQDCPYLDTDDLDQVAMHIIGMDALGEIHAYARILPVNTSYTEYASIGRIITSLESRGTGLGGRLMEESLALCRQLHPQDIKMSAQTYAEEFYKKYDFKSVGVGYLEDGIPHIGMVVKAIL